MLAPETASKARSAITALARKGKAYAQGCTELEIKVQEATNEEPWGPHGSAMLEIARAAEEDRDNIALIMGVIYNRFKEKNLEWRLCYKALLLSEYLIKKGPIDIVDEMVCHIPQFRALQNFTYLDADKRDQGINIRQRASEIVNLLSSTDRIAAERQKARQTAEKYRGLSSSDVARGGLGSSSYSGSSYSSPGFSKTSGSGTATSTGFSRASTKTGLKSTPQDEEDPFEATRRRIEQLRASKPVSPSLECTSVRQPSEPLSPVSGSINMDSAPNLWPELNKGGPKKLSEVKVNPAIAAALGGISSKPSSRPGSNNPTGSAPTHSPPPPAMDLLADFGDDPSYAPAPQQPKPAPPQPQPPTESLLDDVFSSPLGQSPAAGYTQPAPPPPADEDEWGELAGPPAPPPAPKEAPKRTTTKDSGVDVESDPFARLSMYEPEPHVEAGAAQEEDADFAPFVGAPPAPPTSNGAAQDDDPFAEIAHRPVMGGDASMGASRAPPTMQLRGPPAPPKDPFADLLS